MKRNTLVTTRRGALAAVCAATVAFCLGMTGCGSTTTSSDQGKASDAQVQAGAESGQAATSPLEGKALKVYCGAGMADPFKEIADAFAAETGCDVEVVYANAGQIQTQISTTEEGDFFIAGSSEELEPVKDYVASSVELVKHIPVLVVGADNPKDIASVADLANCETLLVGDPESTPVGKIAKKVLTKAGLWDALMEKGAISTTTTAPQIATALANGEGDAGIVWKENVTSDAVTIVDAPEMDAAVKTIPAAQLTCCSDSEAAQAFSEFLQSDEAWDIWASYGYEKA